MPRSRGIILRDAERVGEDEMDAKKAPPPLDDGTVPPGFAAECRAGKTPMVIGAPAAAHAAAQIIAGRMHDVGQIIEPMWGTRSAQALEKMGTPIGTMRSHHLIAGSLRKCEACGDKVSCGFLIPPPSLCTVGSALGPSTCDVAVVEAVSSLAADASTRMYLEAMSDDWARSEEDVPLARDPNRTSPKESPQEARRRSKREAKLRQDKASAAEAAAIEQEAKDKQRDTTDRRNRGGNTAENRTRRALPAGAAEEPPAPAATPP